MRDDAVGFPAGVLEPEYALDAPVDPDIAGVFAELGDTDRAWWMRTRAFVASEVLPGAADRFEQGRFERRLATRLGELDLLRDGIAVPDRPPQSLTAAGLIAMELSRGDGSVAGVAGVQGGLVLRSIATLGDDGQRASWLEPLASGAVLGSFALTEPAHGSDSTSLETRARRTAGGWRLDGAKKWIGNGGVGELAIVWARDEDGSVGGWLVPQDAKGFLARPIARKSALRAMVQAEIRLDGVEVPASARLPGARSFRDVASVLVVTRLGIAWQALGHALAAYEVAVAYTAQRRQFGRPLAASQLVQERLAGMLAGITQLQTLLVRLARRADEDVLTPEAASVAKLAASRTARAVASGSRDLLGGNGLLLPNRVARHLADLEALHTYEGTEWIQALLVGRAVTGVSAFA